MKINKNFLTKKCTACINEQLFINDLPCIKHQEHDNDVKNKVLDFMGISDTGAV